MIELRKATPKAVKYACMNFHYAKSVPAVKYSYNVYNDGEWCGCILYSSGANNHIGNEFCLAQGEILELVRVALNGKQTCTSECVAMSLRQLHKDAPQVKAIVSYADTEQNHIGTIYQATNWLYLGIAKRNARFIANGKKVHKRSINSKGYIASLDWLKQNVDPNIKEEIDKPKHKYLFFFDKRMRKNGLQGQNHIRNGRDKCEREGQKRKLTKFNLRSSAVFNAPMMKYAAGLT